MPQKEVNYDKTHFYKIVCKDLSITNCYVGHTTDFKSRKAHHKSNCYNTNAKHYNLYVYEFIRENGGWDNWDMIEIITEKCLDGLEAKRKERDHIEKLNATLNVIKRPHVSNEEKKELYKQYYDEHIEQLQQQSLNYYHEHKEERLAYKKDYYYSNHDDVLSRKRERRLKNLEEERKKDREQYHKHKDKSLARDKEKISCECGALVSRGWMSEHKKTKKHQQFINQNNPQEPTTDQS